MNEVETSGRRLGQVELRFPAVAIHQLFVSELVPDPGRGPRNGLFLPSWLFERAGLREGEQITLTREHADSRPVDPLNNRTVAPVFSRPRLAGAVAVGPTASFLGRPGPSCCIAYGSTVARQAPPGVDLSFPMNNRENLASDLQAPQGAAAGGKQIGRRFDREVLVASLSGLTVSKGDAFCNPFLAQIPERFLRASGLPLLQIEAYFSALDRQQPALRSYIVPTFEEVVSMSGALFGALPVGTTFVVDVYGRVGASADHEPRQLHCGETPPDG